MISNVSWMSLFQGCPCGGGSTVHACTHEYTRIRPIFPWLIQWNGNQDEHEEAFIHTWHCSKVNRTHRQCFMITCHILSWVCACVCGYYSFTEVQVRLLFGGVPSIWINIMVHIVWLGSLVINFLYFRRHWSAQLMCWTSWGCILWWRGCWVEQRWRSWSLL